MNRINWGIIGCGNVTEAKSGPAFSRVGNSKLAAVMRRDAEKAKDYAERHGVPKWYGDADDLLNDPGIDAVYIATPPDSHAQYAIAAAEAKKHIYVEKPMALDVEQCRLMIEAAERNTVKLFVAYYRRQLDYFTKIKELLDSGAIGTPQHVNVKLFKTGPGKKLEEDELPWRYKKEIAGGGLFVDLGSHQLDLLDFWFGPITAVIGIAANQAGWYPVEDIVCASFKFQSGVMGSGSWCFTAHEKETADQMTVTGTNGHLTFSTFGFTPITLTTPDEIKTFEYPRPNPIQQPMIQSIVKELLGTGKSPSTGITGSRTTWVISQILGDF